MRSNFLSIPILLLSDGCLVLCRKALDCLIDFTETTYSCWIPHLAGAHAGLDQSANRCGNRALPGALDLFASIAFAKSEAVTNRTRVTFYFRSNRFPKVIDGEARSFVAVIDDRAIRFSAEPSRHATDERPQSSQAPDTDQHSTKFAVRRTHL